LQVAIEINLNLNPFRLYFPARFSNLKYQIPKTEALKKYVHIYEYRTKGSTVKVKY